MPRQEEWSPDTTRTKKHKKHKRPHADVEEDDVRKKARQRSVTPERIPDYSSKHKSHKKEHRRSPEVPRSKEVKKERHRDDRHRQSPMQNRRHFKSNVRIKREEDFDRRQEELRDRRREDRYERNDRPRNFHARQEQDERNFSRPRRDFQQERRRNDDARSRERQRRDRDGTTQEAFQANSDDEKKEEKEQPNLGLSGALTEDTNTFRGVVIKYNEPPEARKPKKKWRLYPFKGTETLKTLYLHRQSAFLLGRQRRIADIPVDHPSCSKQHAVLQFRMVEVEVAGVLRRRVLPYVIDLGSANGTYVNNERIEAQRYVELKEQDVLKFGFSTREYVLLHDKSDTSVVLSGSEEED